MDSEKLFSTEISDPTLRRLPSYLDVVTRAREKKIKRLSSAEIGEELDYGSVQVRKDLACISNAGKPRTGFDIEQLYQDLRSALGYDIKRSAILVGVGHLGSALMNYEGFLENGLNIIAGFDVNPVNNDKTQGKIYHNSHLADFLKEHEVDFAIITVPAEEANDVAKLLVENGIKAIWNFSPTVLHVPEDIIVQNENIAEGLAVLWYRMMEKQAKKDELNNE